MDCSTCRSLFSQSFDERLAGERRHEFVLHLQACQPCEGEFTLYRRVFATIRALPDGEAQPFQAPAEVPGALNRFEAPSAPPRFARVAAGILILIGLVGTHVAVFQWSRDHASRDRATPGSPTVERPAVPVLTNAQSMHAVLPSALRDHVDATDLFMRTLDKLPDDATARDVAAADWSVSRLPELTQQLRRAQLEAPPEIRPLVERYLEDAGDDFVPKMRRMIESGQYSVPDIRTAVAMSRVRQVLDRMKFVVAALPRGTAFATCRPADDTFGRLTPDGRRFIELKQARLAGQLSLAIDGFDRFDSEFPKSQLTPAATYLQFEAYNAAGMPGAAWNVLDRSGCIKGPPQEAVRQVARWVSPAQGWGPMWVVPMPSLQDHYQEAVAPSRDFKGFRLTVLGHNGQKMTFTSETIPGAAAGELAPVPESRPSKK
jgi:hypothetical protein